MQENNNQVQVWKVKKLMKQLQAARGNGTSMISLIIPPRDQICIISKMLSDEAGTASNIKSRVNRLSVLGAIVSTQQKLKLYNRVPPNGLVIYCGTVAMEDGKFRKMTIDFQPFKPIHTSLYYCDNKFHTEALNELLEDEDKYGFIIMDGNGCLYGSLQGSARIIIHKFSVDLPKKHGRGGQSALRFARLRLEKRHNYVRKVAEMAVPLFLTDNKLNVRGLILAGSADFKTVLAESDLFDQRLQRGIVNIVDIAYGGEAGFNQAIELSSELLTNVKLVQEKRLLQRYMEQVSMDTGLVCFMARDTLHALEQGGIETLIVHENLDTVRMLMKNKITGEVRVVCASPYQLKTREVDALFTEIGVVCTLATAPIVAPTVAEGDSDFAVHDVEEDGDDDGGGLANLATNTSTSALPIASNLEVIAKDLLVEWLADHYQEFGAKLVFVTNKSQEGSQFCGGFGGVGAFLRWKMDFDQAARAEEANKAVGVASVGVDDDFDDFDEEDRVGGDADEFYF